MAYPGYPGGPGGYPGGGYPPQQGGYPGGYSPQGGYPGGDPYGGQRSYYFIKSRLNDLVLDISGGSRNPGARVCTWHKKQSDHDNQLWYDDPSTGTIRSKLNDFCLDVEGGHLVMKPYQPGDPNQQWERAEPVIRNRMMPNKVLDIANNKREPGATLCSWDNNGGQNQQFHFEYVQGAGQPPAGSYPPAGGYPAGGYPPTGGYPPSGGYPPAGGYPAGGYPPTGSYPPVGQRREFHIESEMNGKVLDVERGSTNPGAKVIMYRKKSPPAKNQLWYMDQQGIIRSALNDFALHASGSGHHISLHPFNGGQEQQWRNQGNKIVNNSGECLDIKGANHGDGVEVVSWQYKGSQNQHWRIQYV